MRSTQLLILAMVAVAACSKPGPPANNTAAPTNAAAAAPAPNPKLARIFTPDVLGANVAFLETITGPAFRAAGTDLTYKVGGCTVIVGAAAGKIDNIGIDGYGPACSFPIARYFAGGYDHPVPPLPTFGDIRQGLGGRYAADCLKLCGNAADPVVWLSYQGSHADNFINLYAAVPVAGDPVLAAWQAWAGKLGAKYGDAVLEGGTAKMDDSLQGVAAQSFANLRPTLIRVGDKLPGDGS
jgi:hypothetical protein